MKHSKQLWNEIVVEIVAFWVLAASIMLLWRDNALLFIVLLVEVMVALGLWHDRYDLSVFLVVAVLGSLAEALFVHSGVWRYANPTLLGVPPWFPLAFGTAALIGERLVCTVTRMWDSSCLPTSKSTLRRILNRPIDPRRNPEPCTSSLSMDDHVELGR
jgi:uncharacterized membrane protein YoaT (DUF817 family)